MNTELYFKNIEKEVRNVYELAEEARSKGLDPVDKVEIPLAMSMAEKVVGLISTIYPQMMNSGIAKRILELEKEYGKLDTTVAFKIAEEVAKQKFCGFETLLQAIDAGIRIGFAYVTLGVVSSPIEGFTELKLGKTREGKDYFIACFSGPIRSAGTTASCVVLMLIDYLRELFGYAKYDATEEEIKRTYAELRDFHDRITNLQYMPTEEETLFLARHIPIQVAGDASEKLEVSNYKNLERVNTNFLRSGFCLILAEGLAQKAAKGFRLLAGVKKNGIKTTGFDFLEDYIKLHEKREKGKADASPTYIKDLVAGRPVFGHPSCSGGFRFRYGRSRVSGFSAASIHPATMAITDGFIAIGTQLKIEKPTKGCVTTSCDSIEGPIVKLISGSVKKIKTKEEAKQIYPDIEEIIYLGDILFPFSDLANRNATLIKPGYVEEWWALNLRTKSKEIENEIDYFNVDFEKAVELSQKFKIPLHPNFIFYWTEISKEQFLNFIDWLHHSVIRDRRIIFPFNKLEQEKFKLGKRALELLGIEHQVSIENVVLNKENSKSLLANLGLNLNLLNNTDFSLKNSVIKETFDLNKDILEIINSFSEFEIKDKAGDFIGTRMGRPEKAKLRKLAGSPNVLFPIGKEGGRLRSVQAACEEGKVRSLFPLYYCEKCKKETIYPCCEDCGGKCRKKYYFYKNKEKSFKRVNEEKEEGTQYCVQDLDIMHYFDKAIQKLNIIKSESPLLIKGIRTTSSTNHALENLSKGVLRAKHNLQVNKDGTIRFDATELPLVCFKPKEIFTSVKKLKELGYDKDIHGKELVNEEQILELMPHDVLIPNFSQTIDEKGEDVFMNICNFVDDLLVNFYKLKSFYNVKKREDLVGQLGVCMAPHNCAGVICRFIGFSNTLGLFASPYMHAAIRRDCVYPMTNFIYSDNGEVKNEAIGNYVENLIEKGHKTRKIDSYGTIRVDLDKELYAFGVDPVSKKLKKKKIKYFIKGAPPEKWVKIKTSSGREQVMTPRHKFIYLDKKNNFQVKKAGEIKKGDRIALINKFDVKSNLIEEVFLPKLLSENLPEKELFKVRVVDAKEFFKKLVKKVGISKFIKLFNINNDFNNLSDWYKLVPLNHVLKFIDHGLMKWQDIPKTAKIRTIFNNKKWDLMFKVGEDLMNVLGYYSAEGHSRQTKTVSQICFRIIDKEQRRKLESSIKGAFGLIPSFGEDKTKITICNKLVYYLFKYCFDAGGGAYEKRVPNIIFNVSEKKVRAYLSCYFDGDGTIVYGKRKFICFYSVSRKLLDGISLLGCKFGLFGRFSKTNERLPGKKVLERYKELNKEPKKHILQHLVYSGEDFYGIVKILNPANKRKLALIKNVEFKNCRKRKIKYNHKFFSLEKENDIFVDIIKEVVFFKEKIPSYCFEVEWESEEDKNVLWGEQIINARCDGDEAAIMLLGDVLLNFSREFLPSHRGGTQDAPLVLNAKIDAGEVDDQILDFEFVYEYPLELYELAEKKEHSSKLKIHNVKEILRKGENPFIGAGFTHDTTDFNNGVPCSSYKLLATMQEKVQHQMELVERIRAADTTATATLVIERHFIRDLRGNLRKFSMQEFRCVACNEIIRRPPLKGTCPKCNGKLIFTIHEGGIKKYLEPALDLAKKYDLSPYVQQNLELVKRYIESIFGKELEKQKPLSEFF
ncbi:MAG: DNA polymerase II large subunit [Nanoarchaeota archaeon]|nr:DNA polymerase II large subunit [Nanoarchaeota archaeon]MBU4116677.1 DNA polymerase II large subunit [Nanoarchaeota archaeon]